MRLPLVLGTGRTGQVDSLRETLVFKGGTALRKCDFGDYRFSEDLDFSGWMACRPQRPSSARSGTWAMQPGHDHDKAMA